MEGADQSWVAALTRYRDPAAEQERDIYADDWFRSQRKLVRTSRAFGGYMEAGAVPGDGAAAPPAGEPPAHPPRKLHTPMDYVRRLNGRVRPPWSLGADAGDSARAQRQRSGKRGSWLRPFTDAQHAADSTEPHSAGIPPSASAPEVAAAPSPIPNGRPLPTFERSAQLGAQHAGGPLAYTTSAPDGGARPWGSQPASGFQPSSPDASASPFDRRIAGAQAGADARQDGDAGRATPLPVAAPALHVSDIPPWAYAPPAPPARNAWGALAQTPVDAGTRVATEPASVYGVATTTSPPVASAPLAMPAAYTQADGLCAPGQRGAIRRQTQPESPLVGKAEAPGSGPSRVFPAPVPEPTLPSEPLTPRPTRTSEAPGPRPTQTSQAGPEPAWPSQPAAPEPTRTAQTPAPEPTRASHAPAPGPAAMRQPAAPVPEPQPPAPVPGATPQLPAAVAAPEPLAPHPPASEPLAPHSTQHRSVSDTTSMLPPSSRRTSTGAYRWRMPGNAMSMLRAPLRELPPMASPPSGGLPPMPEAVPSEGAPLRARRLASDGRPRPVSMATGAPPTASGGRRPVSVAATGGDAPGLRPVSFCPEALGARRSGEPASKKEPAAYRQQVDEYPVHLDPAYSFLPRSVAEMRESLQAARRRTIAADASTEQVSFGVAV